MTLAFWRSPRAEGSTAERLRIAPTVLATGQGDELVLLDLYADRYYTLNAVGSRIWTLLTAGVTRDQLVTAVRTEYELPATIDGDRVARDVDRLLAELRGAGLIVASPDAGSPTHAKQEPGR